MNVFGPNLAALQAIETRISETALRLSRFGANLRTRQAEGAADSTPPNGPDAIGDLTGTDNVPSDPVRDLVSLKLDARLYQANARTVTRLDETLGRVIDILK